MIVEWNNHMFSADQERYPLHPDSPYTPGFPDGDPLDDYIEHMDREGSARAVLVQPAPYQHDHRLILDCLAREARLKNIQKRFGEKKTLHPRRSRSSLKSVMSYC